MSRSTTEGQAAGTRDTTKGGMTTSSICPVTPTKFRNNIRACEVTETWAKCTLPTLCQCHYRMTVSIVQMSKRSSCFELLY
jgi:hypothetical protein